MKYSKYSVNVRGSIRAMVLGDNAHVTMNNGEIVEVNGRTKDGVDRRRQWALAQGASQTMADIYATSTLPESEWSEYFAECRKAKH